MQNLKIRLSDDQGIMLAFSQATGLVITTIRDMGEKQERLAPAAIQHTALRTGYNVVSAKGDRLFNALMPIWEAPGKTPTSHPDYTHKQSEAQMWSTDATLPGDFICVRVDRSGGLFMDIKGHIHGVPSREEVKVGNIHRYEPDAMRNALKTALLPFVDDRQSWRDVYAGGPRVTQTLDV